MKTQYCDECEHRKWVDDGNGLACKIGHKPRFFKPTGNPYFENWGWKRKCADFVVGKHVQMLTPSNALGNSAGACARPVSAANES